MPPGSSGGIALKIELSLEYNPIISQLRKHNVKFDYTKAEQADKYLNMINELRMVDIIDNSMARKAYKRLQPIIEQAIIH